MFLTRIINFFLKQPFYRETPAFLNQTLPHIHAYNILSAMGTRLIFLSQGEIELTK